MKVMNIRGLREGRGMSQQQLAALMHVTTSCVGNWELEISLPRTKQLPDLARALCCTVSDLFMANKLEAG